MNTVARPAGVWPTSSYSTTVVMDLYSGTFASLVLSDQCRCSQNTKTPHRAPSPRLARESAVFSAGRFNSHEEGRRLR